MKLDVTFKKGDKKAYKSARKIIKRLMKQHLEPHLRAFNPEHIRLHASVEQAKKDYQVLLHLNMPPRKVLVAKESAQDLKAAIEEAIKDLSRQAKKQAAKIRGQEHWKRKQRRQRIKDYKNALSTRPPEVKEEVTQTMESVISRIENYIKQELSYLQESGDLPSNYPTMEDVRDEAFMKVQLEGGEFDDQSDDFYQALIKEVNEVLTEEIIQDQLHENDISLESAPEQDALDQAESMVEEDYSEFYQPFERLYIEDIIPDTAVPLPEDILEKNARDASYQVLSQMPIPWRRVVVLTHQEQIPLDRIAMKIMPQPLTELSQILDYAEQFMLASLSDRGYTGINKALLQKLLG